MSTPTDQQQIRATLRRHERTHGTDAAASLALASALEVLGVPAVAMAIGRVDGLHDQIVSIIGLPPVMGTFEAAMAMGVRNGNLNRLSPPLRRMQELKATPIYLTVEVMARKAERDARRGTAA